ncbi:MAG: DNA polymerase III subunit alpha [Alphaproteobacteria bacterium]|nr:DNA polymerase III subunit alpha [Alphaproteobacteria bacterium]|tara:strand:- start:8000 stop:11407 length:3408 start_codon:yes stop_codon:yes gene_type:complete
MPTSDPFIHLHLHSAYSLAEGAIKVKDLVKTCVKRGLPAVAVTDTNNMFGALEFAIEAKKAGVQSIIGVQVTVEDDAQLVLLAQSELGYKNICRLISDAYMHGDAQKVVVSYAALKEFHHDIICLTGGTAGPINKALIHGQQDRAEQIITDLKATFEGRLYIELQRHGWSAEEAVEDALIDMAYAHDVPLVATNDCYFMERKAHEAHDALLCIADGRYVSEDDRRRVTEEHYFKTSEEMCALFADIPEAIENTRVIAQRCAFLLEPIAPILPAFDTAGGRSEFEELKAQAIEGLEWRLSMAGELIHDHDEYMQRLDFELGIINEMGFPGYFLIVSDFIKWAKAENIPVGPGRGSGAGSVVAWALKITDLDPLELGLLFERFLNPERVSMPDFDIDFCQERREEVIRYVQDKYGRDRVAQIITFGKLQARAVVRDVGRVLQMPYGQVDRLSKMIPNNPANPVTLQEALDQDPDLRLEIKKDDTSVRLIEIALQLEGLYRHASTHAAGVVIGDRPLHELVPVYRDPRSDMPVTQFNMKFVEQAGLVKFDFLGLKTMTVLQKAVEIVEHTEGKIIDLLTMPMDDAPTYELMARGDTVGVFQLESTGMRDVLRKVKPNRFSDIIALVSLYRPGPMDNIPTYVAVKEGREEPDYMHPLLKPLLIDTYGIMIYQEQVMQAAQVLAGYSLGGADLLRRAMGKKIKEEMDKQRRMFVDGADEHHNVASEKSEAIFDQIAAFAGYGFNKSHAAAYALIAYWTAYLKCHHPKAFMAASMTLDLGNTDKLAIFKQDMDKMKLPLLQPDLNRSDAIFKVEDDGVRYALGALKGVGEQAMESLVIERREKGDYKSIEDYAGRLDPKSMNRRQLEQMAKAGVFDSLNDHRAQMADGAEVILKHANSLHDERTSGQVSLFGGDDGGAGGLGLPPLPQVPRWSALEQLAAEFGAIGFYLSAHPLDDRLDQFASLGISTLTQIEEALVNKPAARFQVGGVLLKKQERISQKGSKFAFLQLSDPTGVFEVMIFSEMLAASRDHLNPGTMLLLTVEAEQKEDQIRFTCGRIEPLEGALDNKIQTVEVECDQNLNVQELHETLSAAQGGPTRIILQVMIDGGRKAELTLPSRYTLSAEVRDTLRNQNGVVQVRVA